MHGQADEPFEDPLLFRSYQRHQIIPAVHGDSSFSSSLNSCVSSPYFRSGRPRNMTVSSLVADPVVRVWTRYDPSPAPVSVSQRPPDANAEGHMPARLSVTCDWSWPSCTLSLAGSLDIDSLSAFDCQFDQIGLRAVHRGHRRRSPAAFHRRRRRG